MGFVRYNMWVSEVNEEEDYIYAEGYKEGDTFFKIPDGWVVKSEKPYNADVENKYDYTFRVLTKNQSLSSSQDLNSLFG